MKHFIRTITTILAPVLTLTITKPVLCQAVKPVNEYFFHVNDYPGDGATPSWGDKTWAPAGLSHDKDHWYIGSVLREGITGGYKTCNCDWAIWKWPVKEGLDQDLDNGESHNGTEKVKTFRLSTDNKAGSRFAGYGHLGDLDHCIHNGIDYLLLPLTGAGLPPAIAFFRADNLTFVNYSYVPDKNQTDIGWCAFNVSNGDIYTSKDDADSILQYKIDWSLVNDKHHDALSIAHAYKLPQMLHNMQGGEFTPDGQLLYVSSGVVSSHTGWVLDGISVLDATSWKIIQHSTNKERNENSCFNFDFDNSFYTGREPEGLTIWDIDGKGSPRNGLSNLTGQLHVLLDNHNFPASPDVAIMHYKSESIVFPNDIILRASTPIGEPATNVTIAAFLRPTSSYGGCAKVSNNAPAVFPIGKTPVTFTVTQNNNSIIKYVANVTVTDQNDCIVAYYPFNGNANDETGNGFNGTIFGASLTSDRFGKPGSAYSFDGNSRIEVPNSNTMHLHPGALTLTAWVKYKGNYNNEIVSKHLYGAGSGYLLGVYVDQPGFYLDKGCVSNGLYAGKTYNDDKWHFVVGIFDGIFQSIYVDNVLKNRQCADYSLQNNSNLVIGASVAAAGGYAGFFTGSIDEVRIYNCALDTIAINGLYKFGLPAAPTGNVPSGTQPGSTQPNNSGIEIYPNPSNGKFSILLNQPASKTSIIIFNMTGQAILQTTTTKSKTEIDLSTFSPGVYFAQTINENIQTMSRLVKR